MLRTRIEYLKCILHSQTSHSSSPTHQFLDSQYAQPDRRFLSPPATAMFPDRQWSTPPPLPEQPTWFPGPPSREFPMPLMAPPHVAHYYPQYETPPHLCMPFGRQFSPPGVFPFERLPPPIEFTRLSPLLPREFPVRLPDPPGVSYYPFPERPSMPVEQSVPPDVLPQDHLPPPNVFTRLSSGSVLTDVSDRSEPDTANVRMAAADSFRGKTAERTGIAATCTETSACPNCDFGADAGIAIGRHCDRHHAGVTLQQTSTLTVDSETVTTSHQRSQDNTASTVVTDAGKTTAEASLGEWSVPLLCDHVLSIS